MAAKKRLRSDQHQDLQDPENAEGRADTSSKRPRTIGSEAQEEPARCSSPPQLDVAQDTVPRRYATRKSTQVARPAKAAGLVPRTKAEITSAAAAKKEQKRGKVRRVTETKARVAKGVAKLAHLQQERLAADDAEKRDLRTVRHVQDNGPTAQQAPRPTSISRPPTGNGLPRGLYSSSSDSGDDLGDALKRIQLKPVSQTLNRHNGSLARGGSASGYGKGNKPGSNADQDDPEAIEIEYDPEAEKGGLEDGEGRIDELQDDFEADGLAGDPEANELEYDPEADELEYDPEADELEYDPMDEQDNHNQLADEFEDFDADEPEDDAEVGKLEDEAEADESGFEEGDEDGDGDDAEPGAAAPSKLSRAQQRIQKRKEMRERIASGAHPSPQSQTKTPAKSARLTEAPRAAARKKRKNSAEPVFRPDWKAHALERQQPKSASKTPTRSSQPVSAPSHPSSTPSRATRPSQTPSRPSQTPSRSSQIPGGTSGWKAALQPHRPLARSRNAGGGSVSEGEDPAEPDALRLGGFTDADVSSTREYALAAGALRRKSKLVVEAVEESDDDGNGPGARAPVRKRPRRAPSEIPEQESRSSRNLPSFIKPFLNTHIIPTVIDYYGAKVNPWDLQELGRDELLDLCQVLVDEVAPRVGHDVKKSEPIYKLTQQAVYAWRSNFAQAAVSAIQEAITSKFGQPPKIREVKLWAAAAVMSGGEAMWARPKTQAARAEGKLQSKYVLKTFATHLTATTGSLHDYGYPGGALAIAAAAVKHVFPMFETGVFVAAAAFSGTNIENDTSDWYTKTVSKFVRTPDHFKVLLRQAAKFATASKVRKVNPRDREVSVEFSRSSPPLEDHELDMDDH